MAKVLQLPKIALVVPSLAHGGGVPAVARFIKDTIVRAGRYQLKLVSLSTSSRDPQSVMLSRPGTWSRKHMKAEDMWDDMPFVHVGAIFGELEFQRYRPRRELSEELADCDLIQVVSGAPAWANAVIGLGKPVALQVATRIKVERRLRDRSPANLAAWWRKAMTHLVDRLDDRALRAVDAVQVENPWMLEYAKDINASRPSIDVRYAPPGVNARLFGPLAERPSPPNPYILFVGRLADPRKNVALLLDAFSLLPPELSHIHLVTAGSDQLLPEYWQQVEAKGLQGRVRHVYRPDIPELVKLYQECAVFALSSDEEGLGVVILEAMACAVPVVATRCGGPEGIIEDGSDGFLVALDDPAAMAGRLKLLCEDRSLNIAMGLRARKTIEARYAEEVAGRAFLDVWEMLLDRARKAP